MNKAFLAYQYGMANAGDFAINIGSLDLLDEFYDAITIVSKLTANDKEYIRNMEYLRKYYPDFDIIQGPFNLNRGNIFTTLKSYLIGSLKYPVLLNNGKYNNAVKNSNMLFLNGGNILRCESLTDYIRLYALLFPLRLARKHNLDYILLPQSTTSINRKGIKLLEPFLNKAKIVFAREDISYKKLKTNFPNSNIVNSLDSAFFIKDRKMPGSDYEIKYHFLAVKKRNVCIALRKEDLGDIGELSDEKKQKIETAINNLANELLNNDFSLTFVVQTKKDKDFTQKIYKQFEINSEVMIIEEYDPLVLREIYRNSLCLFGMRLHSMILAMSVGTPVVGYFDQNWGNKNSGTLGQFGMPYVYIDQDVDLYPLFEEAQINKERMVIGIENSKKNFLNILNQHIT